MGLGNDDVSVVDDEGGTDSSVGGNGSKKCFGSSVSCSICLEVVADNGDRSWAKLQCGHQFHLGEFRIFDTVFIFFDNFDFDFEFLLIVFFCEIWV